MRYKTKIFPKLNKFSEIIRESSYDILNILNLYDFIELTLDCLVRNNIFVFVTKEELNDICEILENSTIIWITVSQKDNARQEKSIAYPQQVLVF